MTKALFERMRPRREAELLGIARKAAVALRRLAGTRDQLAALVAGPSGSGKSTIAEIMAGRLSTSTMDVHWHNLGAIRGIDFVREIESGIALAAWGHGWRVDVFEEAHNLTAQAQEALLNLTEHYPKRRALIFTTTNEGALTDAFRSRLITVRLPALTPGQLRCLLDKAARQEHIRLNRNAGGRIVDAAQGNARTALNDLEWFGASGQLPEPGAAKVEQEITVGRAAALKAWETRRLAVV